MQIICVGDLCCDLVVPYGDMRKALSCGDIRKETVDKMQVRMQCGGSVGNVARHLGRMGRRPVFVTPLCRDPLGDYLSAEMENAGVDMSWTTETTRSNMYCVAVLDQTGERTMFCFIPPWADYPRFDRHSFDRIPSISNQVLFTSGMAFLDDSENNRAVLGFFTKRKESGATIVFDLNVRAESYGYEGERKTSIERMVGISDFLLGSGREEFCQVTGVDNIRAASEVLLHSGAGCVIARDGGNRILVLGDGVEQYVPVRRVNPVSTIGAGDSFDAAFLKDISFGTDIITAVRNASDYARDYVSGTARETM